MLEKRTLPLSALRAFESVARHLNMSRAGEELGVTHSAISHQVRALETLLAVQLFARAGGRLRLTPGGRRLFESVSDGFDRMLEGAQKLLPDSVAGVLTVGCTQTTGASWAVKHVCEFQQRYPQIEIRVIEIQPNQKSIPTEIDIAICYGEPQPRGRVVKHLASPKLYPYGSPKLLSQHASIRRPEQLQNLPIIHDRENSWRAWYEHMGVAYPVDSTEIFFDNTYLALSAARRGYGVALCNPFETREDLKDGVLLQLLNRPISESHDYFLITDNKEKQSIRTTLFEEWINLAVNQSV
ncbi:MAG: LysR substrate-binding domain-containing protein [Pseudomonadota bacterium]